MNKKCAETALEVILDRGSRHDELGEVGKTGWLFGNPQKEQPGRSNVYYLLPWPYLSTVKQ